MAFAATNAVEHAGAASILVDCDSAIELIDLGAAESVSPRTNAIMPAHLNVRPIDMDRMNQLRDPLGIAVLEDAVHANAARSRRQRTGSHDNLATYSSFVTANVTTTQGGALVMRQSRPWYTIHVTNEVSLSADDLLSQCQQLLSQCQLQLIGIEVHYRGLYRLRIAERATTSIRRAHPSQSRSPVSAIVQSVTLGTKLTDSDQADAISARRSALAAQCRPTHSTLDTP